uniref:ABC transporter substrate-binding protein n=1 Tax=Streptomyces sp. SBT349 TaxID=1580539 RepID=UPI00066D4E67
GSDGAAGGGFERPLTLALADRLAEGVPPRTGRLPLKNYLLLRDVVQWLTGDGVDGGPGPGATPDPTALLHHCYDRRCQRGLVLRALRRLGGTAADGGGAGGPFAAAWQLLAGPLFVTLPRRWWARGRTRRLLWSARHGWYAVAQEIPHGRGAAEFFGSAAQLAPDDLERVLLHALFADLTSATRPRRLSPWHRRRATRYPLLLEHLGGERVARFLGVYAEAVEKAACTATLLVAVAPTENAPGGDRRSPAEAAGALRGEGEGHGHGDAAPAAPLLVPLPDADAAWATRPPHRVRTVTPRTWSLTPATAATGQVLATGTALAAVAYGVVSHVMPSDDDACLGGAGDGRVSAPVPEAEPGSLLPRYREAERRIADENARAEEAARQGATTRTVAYLGTPLGENEDENRLRSDGAVPELRGIALAQAELNDEARSDSQKVWLRVETFDAGPRFTRAVTAAREIVEAAEADPDGLIGVVGIAQSVDVTREAARILDAAEIPTISTYATADEMQAGPFYRQMGPPSSREAEVVSRFMREGNIAVDDSGACAPAEAAIVVQDPADLYSNSIGDGVAAMFEADGGSSQTLLHTPPEAEPRGVTQPSDSEARWETSIHGLATAVCDELLQAADTETVLYWASRARELEAFLNDFEDSTACSGDWLTVVGSDELSGATLSGLSESSSWLRLYQSAQVLPADQAVSHIAREFNARYAAEFGEDDLWRDDGHAALGYDAMQVIAQAANEAYESSGGHSVTRASMQAILHQGVGKAGASGAIDFPQGEPVPRNKPVVILHHTEAGFEPVLACGAFARNAGPVDRWGPDEVFACPTDD